MMCEYKTEILTWDMYNRSRKICSGIEHVLHLHSQVQMSLLCKRHKLTSNSLFSSVQSVSDRTLFGFATAPSLMLNAVGTKTQPALAILRIFRHQKIHQKQQNLEILCYSFAAMPSAKFQKTLQLLIVHNVWWTDHTGRQTKTRLMAGPSPNKSSTFKTKTVSPLH